MKRKRLVVGGILVIVGMLAVGGYLLFKNDKDATDQGDQPTKSAELLSGDSTARDIITPAVSEIKEKHPNDPAAQYAEFLSSGLKKKDFQRYDESIAYLEAAAETAPSDAQKVDAQQLIYIVATEANNVEVREKYKALLGTRLDEQTVTGLSQDI